MAEATIRRPLFRKDVLKVILKLAWPAILEQMLIMIGGIVVTMFLGRYGTNELAAAGLVNMIIVVLQTAFAGLATGSTVVIARITGEKNPRQARSALFQSLFLAVVLSVVITLLTWLAADPLLGFFFRDVGVSVQSLAAVYFGYMLISMPFLALDMTVSASMRGAGDTLTPMLITGFGALVNIVLCLVLIRPMGITGAGIALMSSRLLTCFLRVVLMFFYKRRLYLAPREAALDFVLMLRIFRQGLPAFFEQAIMQGGFLMLNTILAYLGAQALASWQVGVNMNSLAFMPIFGLSIATTTCVGQALGSGRIDDASDYTREAVRLAVLVISAIGAVAAILAHPLASLYSTDPVVLATSVILIYFFACLEPLLGVMNVSAGVLRAGGDIIFVSLTALVGLWVFRIGVSSLLVYGFHLGIYGIMIGTGLDFVTRAALYGLRVRRGQWKYRNV
jgi:putative MATE family efflux protein